MAATHSIGAGDFARMFGVPEDALPACFHEHLAATDTRWREPTREEIEAYLLDVFKRIHTEWRERSPEENLAAFERGWRENLEEVLAKGVSPETIKPRYFRQNKHLRYRRTLIVSDNLDLEYDLFVLARDVIFHAFLKEFDAVYEFGCGSCANLLMLSEFFPDKRLVGLDWTQASVDIADVLASRTGRNIAGQRFDMLNPPDSFEMPAGSAALTVHAMEQLGPRHDAFIDFLLRVRPALVVNYEPILEFYDEDNLYDYLALLYSRRRGYLSGYYSRLKQLEEEGRVEILVARRPELGGVIHEASLIVWRPLG